MKQMEYSSLKIKEKIFMGGVQPSKSIFLKSKCGNIVYRVNSEKEK